MAEHFRAEATMAKFLPNTYYRLQNVDHATYLELPDASFGSAPAMRIKKENRKQMVEFSRHLYDCLV
jgi:hypothetical protein